MTLPLIFFGGSDRFGFDETNYYLPSIVRIRENWPWLDLSADTLSAVVPGYSWFLAGVSLLIGKGVVGLRLVNLLVSYALIALLYLWLRGARTAVDSALAILPLAASNFFVKSSSWVVTDNAALLLVTASLVSMMSQGPGRSVAGSVLAGVGTCVRQMSVWLSAPAVFRVFVEEGSAAEGGDGKTHRRPGLLLRGLLALSPMLVLAVLYRTWGGLVPAQWNREAFKVSLSGEAYLFSVVAIFGLFYFGLGSVRAWAALATRGELVMVALGGMAIALFHPTSASYADGRWGGYLWSLAALLPTLGDRSVLFLPLAVLGLAVVVALWRELRTSASRWQADLWLLALASWATTFLVNRQVFHRYFEPMTLVFLILAFGLGRREDLRGRTRMRLAVCGGMQILGTLGTAYWRTFGS